MCREGLMCCTGVPYPTEGICREACTMRSDRHAKRDFAPVDPETVLARLGQIEVTEWSYRAEPGKHPRRPCSAAGWTAPWVADAAATLVALEAASREVARAAFGNAWRANPSEAAVEAIGAQSEDFERRTCVAGLPFEDEPTGPRFACAFGACRRRCTGLAYSRQRGADVTVAEEAGRTLGVQGTSATRQHRTDAGVGRSIASHAHSARGVRTTVSSHATDHAGGSGGGANERACALGGRRGGAGLSGGWPRGTDASLAHELGGAI
jgi:hypothetical protein